MTMTIQELGEIIAKHKKWIEGDKEGSRANLYGADLSGANLSGANLSGANLYGADLSGADLSGAENASTAFAMTSITPQGDLIGWKKCRTADGGFCIVKLKIPTDAKRSNASGRKCRAEWAEVLEVDGAEVGLSDKDRNFKYIAGQKVTPDKWDDNRWEECSSGIHFFITREEAEAYEL